MLTLMRTTRNVARTRRSVSPYDRVFSMLTIVRYRRARPCTLSLHHCRLVVLFLVSLERRAKASSYGELLPCGGYERVFPNNDYRGPTRILDTHSIQIQIIDTRFALCAVDFSTMLYVSRNDVCASFQYPIAGPDTRTYPHVRETKIAKA